MNKTFGSVTFKLGLRQSTVKHFCRDFNLKNGNQYLFTGNISSDIIQPELIELLEKNITFLLKYQDDYYSDKTPEIIADLLNISQEIIENYLKTNYPNYYENGFFTPKTSYSLRYVSSYLIGKNLGKVYSCLSLDEKINTSSTSALSRKRSKLKLGIF